MIRGLFNNHRQEQLAEVVVTRRRYSRENARQIRRAAQL
jgi:hypothetical protein